MTSYPILMVFGTRTFRDFDLLDDTLTHMTSEIGRVTIVTGEWRGIGRGTANYVGADLLAEQWADLRHWTRMRFPPDFAAHGKPAAFHVRNREMIEYTALNNGFAIGFWDGRSPGTKSVIDLLKKHKVTNHIVTYKE